MAAMETFHYFEETVRTALNFFLSSALARHGISPTVLQEALRSAGVAPIGDAREVVIGASGKISVLER